jgi:hypothetical protein
MRPLLHYRIALLALVLGAQAQTAKPATPPPASAVATEEVSYPLPPDRRGQVRELQYWIDQDEILIQKHQVDIEKLRTDQTARRDNLADLATEFAHIKNLDVNAYELDQASVRLVKKKPPLATAAPAAEKK